MSTRQTGESKSSAKAGPKGNSGTKAKGEKTRGKRAKTAANTAEKPVQQPTGPPQGDMNYNAFQFIRTTEIIGTGSYKSVYKAYDNDTACSVAWNVIKTDKLKPDDKKRAIEEIKLLSSVGKHEHIMAYHCTPLLPLLSHTHARAHRLPP